MHTRRSHGGKHPSSGDREVSDGLGFPGAPVEMLGTGSLTSRSAFSKAEVSLPLPAVLPGSGIPA